MSLYDYLSPPEPEYTDDEWDRARAHLVEERADMGWSEAEIDAAVDDYLIAEMCDQFREDEKSVWADRVLARRKDEGEL